jgi:hypothetical protein
MRTPQPTTDNSFVSYELSIYVLCYAVLCDLTTDVCSMLALPSAGRFSWRKMDKPVKKVASKTNAAQAAGEKRTIKLVYCWSFVASLTCILIAVALTLNTAVLRATLLRQAEIETAVSDASNPLRPAEFCTAIAQNMRVVQFAVASVSGALSVNNASQPAGVPDVAVSSGYAAYGNQMPLSLFFAGMCITMCCKSLLLHS